MTKTDITKHFKQIEEYGGKCITFNSNRPLPTGLIGFPDHILIYKGMMLFVEVKIGKDNFKPGQLEMKEFLKSVSFLNDYVFYLQADETNYSLITECLFQFNYKGLKELEKIGLTKLKNK